MQFCQSVDEWRGRHEKALKEIKTWNDPDIEHKFVMYMKEEKLYLDNSNRIVDDDNEQVVPSFVGNIRLPVYDFTQKKVSLTQYETKKSKTNKVF